jgi:hypothetical protein
MPVNPIFFFFKNQLTSQICDIVKLLFSEKQKAKYLEKIAASDSKNKKFPDINLLVRLLFLLNEWPVGLKKFSKLKYSKCKNILT